MPYFSALLYLNPQANEGLIPTHGGLVYIPFKYTKRKQTCIKTQKDALNLTLKTL